MYHVNVHVRLTVANVTQIKNSTEHHVYEKIKFGIPQHVVVKMLNIQQVLLIIQ